MNAPSDTEAPDWVWTWISSLMQEEPRFVTPVRSNEVNAVFLLEYDGRSLFLKVGPELQREYERLRWLEDRLPCPSPLGFRTDGGMDALLMSAIVGDDLAVLSASVLPQTLISRLVKALKNLHTLNVTDWPFGGIGSVVVHGDACLPNFLFASDRLTGYIDVGGMTLAEPEVDLAAAVWSLQYNLGPGYGLTFLREYGVMDAGEEDVERLRLRYEQG